MIRQAASAAPEYNAQALTKILRYTREIPLRNQERATTMGDGFRIQKRFLRLRHY